MGINIILQYAAASTMVRKAGYELADLADVRLARGALPAEDDV